MAKKTLEIPDLGGVEQAEVVEILVSVGQELSLEQPICVLESDKASMEVPAEIAGTILAIHIKLGERVQEGTALLDMEVSQQSEDADKNTSAKTAKAAEKLAAIQSSATEKSSRQDLIPSTVVPNDSLATEENVKHLERTRLGVYAGPSVRRIAHALGLDLSIIAAETSKRAHVSRADLYAYLKAKIGPGQSNTPNSPDDNPERFGPVQRQKLSKIKQATVRHMQRCLEIPQVTQFELVDITALEQLRQQYKSTLAQQGIRLTVLAFIIKALTSVLPRHPEMNASLDEDEKTLLIKQYYRVGVAVDSAKGLVVPVLADVDQLDIGSIAKRLQDTSAQVRAKGCLPEMLQGGTFTVSSLGGIGGVGFTPIVNAPQVAILGVSRASMQPVWSEQAKEFQPRLMLPLALSYDHRVIDGAQALRFLVDFAKELTEINTVTMMGDIEAKK